MPTPPIVLLTHSGSADLTRDDQFLAEALRDAADVDVLPWDAPDATERAADSVARAADELPQIVERLDRLLSSASTTLATYSGNSDFNRATLSALRDVQQAADAVASLARALERRPNSIILGR